MDQPSPSIEPEYDEPYIRFLEAVWGDGYLSPGGPDEVRRIVGDLDFSGRRVLDIGCGSGGVTVFLAEEFPLEHITGFDVEGPVIEAARRRAGAANLDQRAEFVKGQPGGLPFPDGSFDIVFSKDALIHVSDKEFLFRELFRILKPGESLAASDWLTSHDGPPSPAMERYLKAEGLSFGMASADRYESALTDAGFGEVKIVDRNPWYRVEARTELERLEGPLFDQVVKEVGPELVKKNITIWTEMIKVLDSGELLPTHLRARRPDQGDGSEAMAS
ncbi:MAG: methyltransferase domain-containing protein [Solirubrobacterales bacterium]|nr:methyltransferase domain-containing protein [Solirubrobacterales bacterium]